ncbi:D-alanyl-D-alanine carboxypeptidase [Streptomyces sp. MST-110588]|uniref:D-alanyl-D-alanine carboxypeptidase n=1 Tax=Streptomyces sp. MST-110588 TaxID=2833628 RepID=UPI001F5CDC09|nr:D-alanyl-D-alanine carboxypeptidase [Streptomyces sp. MST-110588]UNO39088.1 D-alanyl-D-alanine carboxypeptidase [Streptomyces sp. MST-110588]
MSEISVTGESPDPSERSRPSGDQTCKPGGTTAAEPMSADGKADGKGDAEGSGDATSRATDAGTGRGADTEEKATAEPGAAPGADVAPEEDPEPKATAAQPKAEAAAQAKPEAAAEPKTADGPKAAEPEPAEPKAADKPGPVADPEPTMQLKTTAVPKWAAEREGGEGSGTGTEGGPDAKHQAGPRTDGKTAEKPTPKTAETTEKPGADKPGADKPGAAKPAAEESDSERTSRFVALKSTDVRPAKPPKPVTPTAPAARTAPPAATPPVTPAAPPAPSGTPASPAPAKTAGAPASAAASPSPEAAGLPETERTQQQPLPPLDLLAQLTNTPPPPETPMRTVVRRVKIWTPIVALLAIIFVVVQMVRPLPDPSTVLTAKATTVFEGAKPSLPWPSEGQAVVDINGLGHMGSYGEMKPLPIGSVAKVMTSYLILKSHPLKGDAKGPSIDVDQKAEDDYTKGDAEKESVVEVHKGQRITEREAIEAVMLPSANNVARLLARWDAGSEEAFIAKMNATAKELGMTNTTYTDASGLQESTVSTAEDQVKLAKKAMTDPVFRAIAKMPSYTSTTTSGGNTEATRRVQRNFNKLIPMYGVVGIKTGSTTKAGGNLLFAAEKTVGGTKQLIIGALFGQHKKPAIDTAMFGSRDLILAAGKDLTTRQVVKKGAVVGAVDDGLGGRTPLVATKDMTVIGWPGASVTLKLSDGGKPVPHSAKAGTTVGVLTAGSGMGEVKMPVALQKDLAEPSFGAKLTRLG